MKGEEKPMNPKNWLKAIAKAFLTIVFGKQYMKQRLPIIQEHKGPVTKGWRPAGEYPAIATRDVIHIGLYEDRVEVNNLIQSWGLQRLHFVMDETNRRVTVYIDESDIVEKLES